MTKRDDFDKGLKEKIQVCSNPHCLYILDGAAWRVLD